MTEIFLVTARRELKPLVFVVFAMSRGSDGGGGAFVRCLLVGCLTSQQHAGYLRDGSAQTIVRAATLRQKLQVKLSTSPSHSILTPGRPVPGADPITPGAWQSSHWSANFQVTGMTRPGNIPTAQAGIKPRTFGSRGGRLNHQANETVGAAKRREVGDGGEGVGVGQTGPK